MGSENFCLKWNDHHSTFFSSAESLCSNQNLTDVVLSAGGKQFQAHKLVLSICSSYFKDLFSSSSLMTRDKAAVVFLKDVEPMHLELILNYMYRGEVNVPEIELMSLLNTAKGLQIKGLSNNNEEATTKQVNTKNIAKRPLNDKRVESDDKISVITPSKRIREEIESVSQDSFENKNVSNENSDIGNVAKDLPAKSGFSSNEHSQPLFSDCVEPNENEIPDISDLRPGENDCLTDFEREQRDMKAEFCRRYLQIENKESLHSDFNGESCTLASSSSKPLISNQDSDNDDTGSENDFGRRASEFVVKNGKSFECTLCKKVFKKSCVVHLHIRSVHLNRPVRCEKCGREFKSVRTLGPHIKNNTMNKICVTNQMLLDS